MAGPALEGFFTVEVHGQVIAGIVHEPVDLPPRALIMTVHGFDGQRIVSHRILVKSSRNWSAAGFVSVRFDHRGCGLSDGEFWQCAWPERIEDVRAIAAYLRHRYPDVPLVMHGFSDGCRSALMAAAEIRPAALVLWSPILLAGQGPPGWTQPPWERHPTDRTPVRPIYGLWISHRYFVNLDKWVPESICHVPMLVAVGDQDGYIKPSIAALQAAYPQLELRNVCMADHLYCLGMSEEAVICLTVQWLNKTVSQLIG